jgi:hypothetical protein
MAWMTPAAACALLVTLGLPSLSQVGGYPLARLPTGDAAQRAILQFAAEQSSQNALPIASFTWTNRIPAPSTTRSGTSVQ